MVRNIVFFIHNIIGLGRDTVEHGETKIHIIIHNYITDVVVGDLGCQVTCRVLTHAQKLES